MSRRPPPPRRSPRKPPPKRAKPAPTVKIETPEQPPLSLRRERTLREARATVEAGMVDGVNCPCCGQFAKIYRRKVHAGMAAWLVRLVKLHRSPDTGPWVHHSAASTPKTSRDYPGLRYWGLIEQNPDDRGFWRPTQFGLDFVDKKREIHAYALVYDGECKGYDTSTSVGIEEALGTKFTLADLMAGE